MNFFGDGDYSEVASVNMKRRKYKVMSAMN